MSDDRSRDPVYLGWLAETRRLLAENGGSRFVSAAPLLEKVDITEPVQASRMIVKFVDAAGRVSYEDMVLNDVYLPTATRPHPDDARKVFALSAVHHHIPPCRQQHFTREVLSYPEGFIGPLESSAIYAGRGHTDVVVFVEGEGGGWIGWEH